MYLQYLNRCANKFPYTGHCLYKFGNICPMPADFKGLRKLPKAPQLERISASTYENTAGERKIVPPKPYHQILFPTSRTPAPDT